MTIERIDSDLCVGCGVCVSSCPTDVIRLDDFVIEKEEFPSCRAACPAGVNTRGFIYFLKQGRIEEAIKVIREALPLPAVTGRVCFHPCESDCAHKAIDEAVNINGLERYVADYWLDEKAERILPLYVPKVAIVGSGPAGLAAAYDLIRMGYPVTVFESMPVLGGMLRVGIPEYRLPRDVLDAQINYIEGLGVEFKTETTIGKDLTIDDLKNSGYHAVLFAIGAQRSKKLNAKGAQCNEVLWGLDFLRDVNLKRKVTLMPRVLVIGGGNVAMDAALTALRVGAKEVQLACLESEGNMPVHEDSLNQAIREGITIHTSWGLETVTSSNNKVTGVQLVRCISVLDKQGNFNPSFDRGITKRIETDMIIFAIGEEPDLSLIPAKITCSDTGTIVVDQLTSETSIPGVFAAGVAVLGPASVVESIATGKRAATSIDRYLRHKDPKLGRGIQVRRVKTPPKQWENQTPRQKAEFLPVGMTIGNFKEVKTALTGVAAMEESQRCMACGSKAFVKYLEDCMTCYLCEIGCPEKAIYVSHKTIAPYLLSWG